MTVQVGSSRSTGSSILAQNAGLDQGADYSFLDLGVISGDPTLYVLEVIKLDGSVERYNPEEIAVFE